MSDLTNPEPPDVLSPADPGFLAGDAKDDDGTWIDEVLEAGPVGPEERTYIDYPTEEIAQPTRILSRQIRIGTNDGILYDAVMALPSDLNRVSLIIETDGAISITSDKTDAVGAAILAGGKPFTTDTHTGAVWVNSAATVPVNVSIWAVTS